MRLKLRIPGSIVAATVAVLGLGACAGDESGDEGANDARTYVSMLGEDTLGIERFTRTESTIEGTLISRNPNTHTVTYTAQLDEATGRIRRLDAEMSRADSAGGWSRESWTVEVGEGVATVTRHDGENAGTHEVAIDSSAVASLGRAPVSVFAMEQAIREAAATSHETHPVQFVSHRPRAADNAVTVVAGDTVSISYFGNPMKVWTRDGTVVGVSGAETTMRQEVRLATTQPDVDALPDAWAAMDARGEGLGTPSPAATATASVGGAEVEIRYSRPAKRGREIWGNLVPEGAVWRTGANAATHLTTNRTLRIGDVRMPAGTYTLWSLFEGGRGTLIVNEQTEQWGTQYDEARDLGRTALTRSSLDEAGERFMISISDGMLHLDWDTTRWSVPIRAG